MSRKPADKDVCATHAQAAAVRGRDCCVWRYHKRESMKQISIGVSELKTSCLAYGCWRIAGDVGPDGPSSEAVDAGKQAVIAAYEAGYTLFDNADIYGGGDCETLFGEILKENPDLRDRIIITSKCGIRDRTAIAGTAVV